VQERPAQERLRLNWIQPNWGMWLPFSHYSSALGMGAIEKNTLYGGF
jgi:hypothetical protein